MSLLEYALEYARNGFYVFPLGVGKKIPAFAGGKGHNDATIDLNLIREWWADIEYNIGIACGIKSNLSVIDLDGKQGMESSRRIKAFIPETLLVKTPHGTHIYLRYNEDLKLTVNILEKVDIRSEGGYVVAPPSVVDGVTYEFKDSSIPIATMHHVPDLLKIRERTNGASPSVTPEGLPNRITTALQGVAEGNRDATAISLAGYFHGIGMPEDIIEAVMTPFANACTPPYPLEDLRKTIKSAVRYPNNAQEHANIAEHGYEDGELLEETDQNHNLSASIRQWIDETTSWWTTDELDNELGIRTPKDKNMRKQLLFQLRKGSKIRRHQTVNKRFRKVDTEVIGLDYKKQQDVKVLDLRWPLGIEELVNLYPGNLVVVAGSPNSGKTALLLNVIRLNQDRMPIHYFCSEMGVQELQGRLELFDTPLADWKFEAIERSSNFADVIVPDCINIIDFMELTEDIYKVNTYLTELTHVIGNGVVIVAVQKKIGALMGRGQEFSLEKPRLYLSLDDSKIKIAKGKHWAQKNYNPSGLERLFSIEGGSYFIPSTGWQDPR